MDIDGNRYSTKKELQQKAENNTGFELFSDRIARLFPSYTLDEELKVIVTQDTPTVNFNYLKELLLSKDISREIELEWVKKQERFLDQTVDME